MFTIGERFWKELWDLRKLNKLSKSELINSCSLELKETEYKGKIIQAAHNKVKKDSTLAKNLYHAYGNVLSLTPTEVEEILKITKSERILWEKDKLKVTHRKIITYNGKNTLCSMYDYLTIMQISEEDIEDWRYEYKQQMKSKRLDSQRKTKKKNIEDHDIQQLSFL